VQEEFGETVAEAGLEVAELALLVLEGAECGDARVGGVGSRVSGLKARVDSLVEVLPAGDVGGERARRVQAVVVRLANQVRGAEATARTEMFVIDEDSDEGMPTPEVEREARKKELAVLFSSKPPVGR
jgi:hypothetical protein